MKLRRLELRDAPFMLEWMHEKSVVQDLRTDFLSKTLNDCETFIEKSWSDLYNCNLAVVDCNDMYMGTVSLKNMKENTAEFGITVRSCAMGKGYSIWAMKEIFRIAYEDKNIQMIYWCVSPENKRAVRFYDKNNFLRVNACELKMIEGYTEEQVEDYVWYAQKLNAAEDEKYEEKKIDKLNI